MTDDRRPWRVGRKLGRTVYAQDSDESCHDVLLGLMETRELAAYIVRLHNQRVGTASSTARRFTLERDVDLSGLSGTGTVADGVVWPDGAVTIRWRGQRPSTVNWDHLDDAQAINGHAGATRFEMID